jgi:hypothetical protein
MRRQVFFAAAMVLFVASTVRADVGLPSLGSPDFANSSSATSASFGLSLAAMLIFGGYWLIRNPWAGLVSFCLGAGMVSFLIGAGLCCLGVFDGLDLAFLMGSALFVGAGACLLFWGGKRIRGCMPSFVGVNLLFLLLSLAGGIATLVSLGQLTWTNPRAEREERRKQRQQQEKERTSLTQDQNKSPSGN